MTESEIQRLFVEHPFGEAKRLLAEDIEKSGRELSGNENVFELKSIALECSRMARSVSGEQVKATSGEENGKAGAEKETARATTESSGGATGESSGGKSGGTKAEQQTLPFGNEEQAPENAQSIIDSMLSGKKEKASSKGGEGGEENAEGGELGEVKPNGEPSREGAENAPPSHPQGECEKARAEGGERPQGAQSPENAKPRRKRGTGNAESPENGKEGKPKSGEQAERELEEMASSLMKEARRKIEEANAMREKRLREEEERRKAEEERKSKGDRHYMTDEVVKRLKCLRKAFLVGPAGTGKTTLAMCACRELFGIRGGLDAVVKSGKFAQISFSPDTVSADMLGFTDVNGVFHETDIIKVFRDGGLILFDEMDDADASLLVKLNTMLANGVIPVPGGCVTQNPETYIVGTANTYGTGGNSVYVGRSRLDGATLDRWKMATIEVGYDTVLEMNILAKTLGKENPRMCFEIMSTALVIREKINANKWKQICSTRFVCDSARMGASGYSFQKILDTFLLDWNEANAKTVRTAVRDALKDKEALASGMEWYSKAAKEMAS